MSLWGVPAKEYRVKQPSKPKGSSNQIIQCSAGGGSPVCAVVVICDNSKTRDSRAPNVSPVRYPFPFGRRPTAQDLPATIAVKV